MNALLLAALTALLLAATNALRPLFYLLRTVTS